MGKPISPPNDLHILPTGDPWQRTVPDQNVMGVGTVPRNPLYFSKHIVDSAQRHLSPELLLHDAPPAEQEQVCRDALALTLNHLQAVTTEGALTRRSSGHPHRNDRSMDYVCHWSDIRRTWHRGNVITVVVRDCEVDPPGITVEEHVDVGPVNLAVTLVPVGKAWERILSGEPVPDGYATYLIDVGDRFSLEIHCTFYRMPRSEIFGPAPN
jgi:hypothetical protein